MSVRRLSRSLASILSVCLVGSVTVATAQPKAGAPAGDQKGTVAPTTDAATPGSAAPVGGSGDVVQMTEDAPPADMEGKDENPDAPKSLGDEPAVTVAAPMKATRAGYPIEEALRPITLPKNMSEVALVPQATVDEFQASTALRARYGITRRVQLGLTYILGGANNDPATLANDKIGFHPGKAVGLDVTVLLQNWIGLRLGVPVWIDRPVAVGIQFGVPLKFILNEKFALGGLDDLLSVRVTRFAPTFLTESENAARAAADDSGTISSKGQLRLSGYGIYQQSPKLGLFGRLSLMFEDFATTKTAAGGGIRTTLRAGLQYTPRSYLDVGLSLGFEDLAEVGSFGPIALVALRI